MTDRPAIKPLEWHASSMTNDIGDKTMRYGASPMTNVFYWIFEGTNGFILQGRGTFPTVEAAQEAAQDEWYRRIRSCLLDKPEAVEGERLESARAEQWRLRREAEAGRDTAKAVAHSFRNERDALREALSDIIEGWDFWEVNHHDREPPRDAIRRARAALSTPADTDAAQSGGEAFDKIVAARKAHIDAVAAYNARLEFVRAERERGNWLNVDPEYAAMSEAQSAFYRTVQDLADAAISQRAEEE
ncbi:hypothetical protein [Sinorhizobium meliloti]|uniref:hypothetical protein n=1 Tax=Rhizobium meliloti TaxID=382 RepID=UPI001F248B8C|nr:hypothetical protein [Sinorhizobium meliloti]